MVNILKVFEFVKSIAGLSGDAEVAELDVYGAYTRGDGVTARVMGFVINAKGSQHKLHVVCALNGEDWSKIKAILPKLLSKIRWRNRNIFDLILFHLMSWLITILMRVTEMSMRRLYSR